VAATVRDAKSEVERHLRLSQLLVRQYPWTQE